MHSNLLKLKSCIESMYDINKGKNWFSTLGTSILYYLDKFINNIEKLKLKSTFNLDDPDDVQFIIENLYTKKRGDNDASRRQFFNFLNSLNIVEKNKNHIKVIKFSNEIDTNFILKEWSIFINTNTKHSTDHNCSLRIINGFFVYCIFQLLDNKDFELIYNCLDKEISSKIYSAFFEVHPKNNKPSYETTYKNFYDKYFSDLTIDKLLKYLEIYNKVYDHENIVSEIKKLIATDYINEREVNEEEIAYEIKTLVDSRIGQSKFRSDILKLHNNKCFISGIKVDNNTSSLIVASHIIPWSECKGDIIYKKTDKYNGLPLISSIDKLFDNYLISFNDEGKLYVSNKLKNNKEYESILSICGIPDDYIRNNKSIYEQKDLSDDQINEIKNNMKHHFDKTSENK